jgi:hypothetical protein
VQQPPLQALPATGYVANEVAAGFLYLTNSSLVWIEWVVSDKSADKELRNKSVNEVIEHCKKVGKLTGSTAAFTSVKRGAFCERLKKLGFKTTDEGMTNMICQLGD